MKAKIQTRGKEADVRLDGSIYSSGIKNIFQEKSRLRKILAEAAKVVGPDRGRIKERLRRFTRVPCLPAPHELGNNIIVDLRHDPPRAVLSVDEKHRRGNYRADVIAAQTKKDNTIVIFSLGELQEDSN